MSESPVQRIMAEVSLDEKINALSDVKVYIKHNQKLLSQITAKCNLTREVKN
jgi:hypothetical protein